MLNTFRFRHLSFAPNILGYFIFSADGIQPLTIRVSPPLGIAIKPVPNGFPASPSLQ